MDGLERDGLFDAYGNEAMGCYAELCASEHGLSREQQDDHAVSTCKRAIAATEGGAFGWEIAPVRGACERSKDPISGELLGHGLGSLTHHELLDVNESNLPDIGLPDYHAVNR